MLTLGLVESAKTTNRRRSAGVVIVAVCLAAFISLLLVQAVRGSSDVITGPQQEVNAVGDWTGQVAPGSEQTWKFDIPEDGEIHLIYISNLVPSDSTLVVSVFCDCPEDRPVLGTASPVGDFLAKLSDASTGIRVSNPGAVAVQYNLHVGSPIEDLLNTLIKVLTGHNDGVIVSLTNIGSNLTALTNSISALNTGISTAISNQSSAFATALADAGAAFAAALDIHNTALAGHNTILTAHTAATDGAIAALVTALGNHQTSIATALGNHQTSIATALAGLATALGNHQTAIDAHLDDQDADLTAHDDKIAAKLDNETAMKLVDVEVITLKKDDRYLVFGTEAGQPVAITLDSLVVLSRIGEGPVTAVSGTTTTTVVKTGVLDVEINSPMDGDVLEFQVSHDHGVVPILGSVVHHGTGVIPRDHKDE